jgi:hypothetical protein
VGTDFAVAPRWAHVGGCVGRPVVDGVFGAKLAASTKPNRHRPKTPTLRIASQLEMFLHRVGFRFETHCRPYKGGVFKSMLWAAMLKIRSIHCDFTDEASLRFLSDVEDEIPLLW